MLQPLKSCTESRPSLRSVGVEEQRESDSGMKPRCNGISSASLAMNIYPDPGLCTEFENVRKLLTTLSLMDSLSNLIGEPLLSSKSNTITVRIVTFNLWTNISRWLRHFLEMPFGCFRLSPLSNGTIATLTIQRAYDCATALRSVQQLRLACISVDLTEISNEQSAKAARLFFKERAVEILRGEDV